MQRSVKSRVIASNSTGRRPGPTRRSELAIRHAAGGQGRTSLVLLDSIAAGGRLQQRVAGVRPDPVGVIPVYPPALPWGPRSMKKAGR